jgi:GNAT superfamily N-acetyltransferase
LDNPIPYKIRPIQTDDIDELLVMMQEHADYEQAAFSPEGKKERLIPALFSNPPKLYCWLVEMEQGLAGFVSYTFDYSTWDAADFLYMDCLFLREYARGYGIGKVILERLKAIAAANQCINIQWQTPVSNVRGIHFYRKNGAEASEKARFVLKCDADR